MADIDIPIKSLMQSRIEDWVRLLVPKCQKEWIKELDPSKVPAKKESRLDKLILIDSPKEKFIINIEPQGYLDKKMPARMLRYRADIWEHTIGIGLGMPSIKQAVIYFYKEHDNKQNHLVDEWEDEETLSYSYKVIKVWEIKSDQVIASRLEGLYPLLPLMDRGTDTKEEVIEETVKVIQMVEGDSFRSDLLAVMTILAKEKFTKELVTKYVRRKMLMGSPIYQEWVEEERREAAEEATTKAAETIREGIMYSFELKFGLIPGSIIRNIKVVEDVSILQGIQRKLISASNVQEFEEYLDKSIK